MITQEYNIDLIPNSVPVVVPVSQYDSASRTLQFNLLQAGTSYTIDSDTSAYIKGTKKDGTGFMYSMTVGADYVTVDIQEQMTAVSGDVICEVSLLALDGAVLGTANFILRVEPTALKDDVVSETEISIFQETLDKAQEIVATEEEIIKKGLKGDKGDSGTIAVGTVTTLSAGSQATVTNVGTDTDAIFDFGIPQGEKGEAGSDGESATITVGTVTTLSAESSATVENTGTETNAIFNFGIPQGVKGEQGETGASGQNATITVGTVTTLDAGSQATVTNSGTETDAILNFGLPKGADGTGSGTVTAVNGVSPNASGNVELDLGVLTVNGQAPDENGNVDVSTGTLSYTELTDKPSINSVELTGDKTLTELGIASSTELSSKVSSVNDVTPDENGNVEIDVGVKSVNSVLPVDGNVTFSYVASVSTRATTVTIASTDWTDDTATVTLMATAIGIVTSALTVEPCVPETITLEQLQALSNAMIVLTSVTSESVTSGIQNTFTFSALNGAPTVDIPLKIVALYAS